MDKQNFYLKLQKMIQPATYLVLIMFVIAVIINRKCTVRATYGNPEVSDNSLSQNTQEKQTGGLADITDTKYVGISAGEARVGVQPASAIPAAVSIKEASATKQPEIVVPAGIKISDTENNDTPDNNASAESSTEDIKVREAEKDGNQIDIIKTGNTGFLSIKGEPQAVMISSPAGDGSYGADVAEKEIDAIGSVKLEKVRIIGSPTQEPVTISITLDNREIKSITIFSSWLLKYDGQYYYSETHKIRYLMPSSALSSQDGSYGSESRGAGIEIIDNETEAAFNSPDTGQTASDTINTQNAVITDIAETCYPEGGQED